MLTSDEFKTRKTCAEYLSKAYRTNWEKYDFTHRLPDFEARVPDVEFLVNSVKVLQNEVHHLGCRYTREVVVRFANMTFVFVIATRVQDTVLKGFTVSIYTPVGDAKGALVSLYTSKI